MFIFDNFEYKIYNNLIDNLYNCSGLEDMNTILNTYISKLYQLIVQYFYYTRRMVSLLNQVIL